MKNDQQEFRAVGDLKVERRASGDAPGWDDVPAKTVGRRKMRGLEQRAGYGIQSLANQLSGKRVQWPKGVFRFKTFEEADQWWIKTMTIRKP